MLNFNNIQFLFKNVDETLKNNFSVCEAFQKSLIAKKLLSLDESHLM